MPIHVFSRLSGRGFGDSDMHALSQETWPMNTPYTKMSSSNQLGLIPEIQEASFFTKRQDKPKTEDLFYAMGEFFYAILSRKGKDGLPDASCATHWAQVWSRLLVRAPQVKIAVLGSPGVGKTSIIQQFVCHQFTDEYVPTSMRQVYYPSIIINDHLYEVCAARGGTSFSGSHHPGPATEGAWCLSQEHASPTWATCVSVILNSSSAVLARLRNWSENIPNVFGHCMRDCLP